MKIFKEFVDFVAADFRGELMSLPGTVRREVQETEISTKWQLEDAVEKAVHKWMLAYSTRELPLPKPLRTSSYSIRPGPKPGTKRNKVSGGVKNGTAG